MGSILLAADTKGKRMALPNSKIMIHQGSAGYEGTPSDIEIQAREVLGLKRRMESIIAKHSGQTEDEVRVDMDRDYYTCAAEALDYGLVDRGIEEC